MPRTSRVPSDEARKIELWIKKQIVGAGSNVTEVTRLLNAKYNNGETPQVLTQQLKQGTIPFWKVLRIASVLGCEIEWKDK